MTGTHRAPKEAFLRPSGRFSWWRFATAVVAVAAYALIWVGWVRDWGLLDRLDWDALDFFHAYGVDHAGWVHFWRIFCEVFDPMVWRLILIVPIVMAFKRGARATGWFLTVTAWGSGAVVFVGKHLANRPRPDTALVHALGSSFPSGHATGSFVMVWAVLAVALPLMARNLRPVAVVVGVALVVTVGVARVILNVHHPSDILAGWLIGYAYFQCCWMLWPPTPPGPRVMEPPEDFTVAVRWEQ